MDFKSVPIYFKRKLLVICVHKWSLVLFFLLKLQWNFGFGLFFTFQSSNITFCQTRFLSSLAELLRSDYRKHDFTVIRSVAFTSYVSIVP